MKKLWLLLLVFAMLIGTMPTAVAYNDQGQTLLSSLSDTELLIFIESSGIVISEGYFGTEAETADVIRKWVVDVEQNPNVQFIYGSPVLAQMASSVKNVVNSYYADANIALVAPLSMTGVLELQDSTVYDWRTPNLVNYNCYAYVMGHTTSGYDIGGPRSGPSLSASQRGSMSMSEIATVVKEDIIALGYSCVEISSSRPTSSSLSSGQTAIAVRIDTQSYDHDFHFMKLSGSVWRHKPGNTAILTYNYLPSNDRNWISEGVLVYQGWEDDSAYPNGVVMIGSSVYDSSIYYLMYRSVHNETEAYTGNNYHKGVLHYYEYEYTCNDCGATRTAFKTEVCDGEHGEIIMSLLRKE